MKLWASYANVVKYSTSGIDLHATERKAYLAVASLLEGFADMKERDVKEFWELLESDPMEFHDRFQAMADREGLDYHIQEVSFRTPPAKRKKAKRR